MDIIPSFQPLSKLFDLRCLSHHIFKCPGSIFFSPKRSIFIESNAYRSLFLDRKIFLDRKLFLFLLEEAFDLGLISNIFWLIIIE